MNPCIVCNSTNIERVERNNLPLFHCVACGLLWRQTFDVPLAHYETTDPRSSSERSDARMRNSNDRVRTMFAQLPLTGVCDVGTGEGTFLVALREAGGSGVGIEPGVAYREEAARNGVRMVGKTYEDVPRVVAEEKIKTLTLFHVIEHVERPDLMLKLFFDALPTSGHLVIETPTMDSPVLKAAKFVHGLIYPEHLYYFSENNLSQLLEKIGFEVVSHGRRGFDQYAIPIGESIRRLLFVRSGKQQQLPHIRYSGTLRERVRQFLARRVVATGRVTFMWFVAIKK